MNNMRRVTLLFAAALLATASGNSTASAESKTIFVSGDSVPSECGKDKKADLSTELKDGNLTGCLAAFVQHVNCREMNGYSFTTELGREEFEGKLDGEPIKFSTIYTFEATWPKGSCPKPDPVQEITGGCDHFISGEKVQGFLRFYDVMPVVGKGGTHFFYQGNLTLD